MGPEPGQKGSWNAQRVLGMTRFTESLFRCLVTSEVTRTQDPHQQTRNEISACLLSFSANPMTRKNTSSKRVVWTRSNGEIRKGGIIIISTESLVPNTKPQVSLEGPSPPCPGPHPGQVWVPFPGQVPSCLIGPQRGLYDPSGPLSALQGSIGRSRAHLLVREVGLPLELYGPSRGHVELTQHFQIFPNIVRRFPTCSDFSWHL